MFRMRLALVIVAVAVGPFAFGEDKPVKPPKRPDLKATLTGQRDFEKAKGTVVYRDRPDERFLEVEVSKVPLPFGTEMAVDVNGRSIGRIKLNPLHGGKLKLESEDGDVVPFVTLGSTVTVRSPKKQLVLSARF